MSEQRPAPTEEQQEAIDDRGRDLFLVAGAGTGKTTVLVDRFCDIVCAEEGPDGDAGMENVLAFTFTERAAGQLKRRIRAELLRRSEADPEQRLALRRMARDSESAWISTFHGFCQRVLASHALAAGLDPRYAVLDDSESSRVAQDAFDSAFTAFAGEGGGDDRFEMAAAFGVDGLRDMVRAAHDELRSQGHDRPELPELGRIDLEAAVQRLRAAATVALEDTAEAKRADMHRDKMAAALAGTDGRVPEEGEPDSWRVKSKADAFQIESVDEYNAACKALDSRLAEAGFAHYYDYIRDLVARYRDAYEQLKSARSALDFEDLQLRARALLASSPEIRESYQRRFAHLLVDEFQDTNKLQASIIELLHAEEGRPANRLFTVGDELQSIYGFRHADVEVFRAQRAAAAAVEEEALAAGREPPAGVRLLTGNFRSGPEVLSLVNKVGEALFGEAVTPLAVAAKALPKRPPAEVLVTERKGWPDDIEFEGGISADEQAQPWRLAEAQALAGRLSELVVKEGVPRGDIVVLLRSYTHVQAYERAMSMAGLRPYVIGGRGYWSRQQVADTRALLACIANPLDDRALMDALASPVCGVRPDTLWLLSRATGKAPLWWAVKRLFGKAPEREPKSEPEGADGEPDAGSSEESWAERVDRRGASIPAADGDLVTAFVATLDTLRAEAPTLSLDALIDRAVTATGYDLALLMRPGGRRRMANVRKLMRLAREFESDQGRDLRGFLDWAASEADTSRREAEATIQAEGHDGVRVMTIHGSKGLEFPVVAVADLGRGLGAGGAGAALRLAPDPDDPEGGAMRVGLRLARLGRARRSIFHYQDLADAAAERDREEERRLLHVAMTRAEQRLILSGAADTEALEKEPSRGEPLMGAVLRVIGWAPGQEKVALPGNARVVVSLTRPPEEGDPVDQLQLLVQSDIDESTGTPLEPLADPDLAPPAAARQVPPVTHVSYSSLSLYERCGYRYYAEQVLGLGRSPASPQGTAVGPGTPDDPDYHDPVSLEEADALEHRYARGTVVHELLELSARGGWARPEEAVAGALLEREGVPAAAGLGRVRDLVNGFLDSPLRAELAAATVVHPELPFAFRLGDLIVRGEIDLLAELEGEVVVVDYKSDALGEDSPEDHMDRYEVQRRIYALAALRRFGLPVRVVYAFLDRPDAPVEARFEPGEVDSLIAGLEAAAEGIVAGRFEVTSTPGRALCFDCPARKHLCSHDETATLAG